MKKNFENTFCRMLYSKSVTLSTFHLISYSNPYLNKKLKFQAQFHHHHHSFIIIIHEFFNLAQANTAILSKIVPFTFTIQIFKGASLDKFPTLWNIQLQLTVPRNFWNWEPNFLAERSWIGGFSRSPRFTYLSLINYFH